ncbi:MAG: S1 RNA-binding domain-containing protein [archaeon]
MDYPTRDDIVIVKVTQILDYGAFVELLEYKGARGFVHISHVSSSWVKNIRNFVKMNQVRAAKVLNVDPSKNQIDLSFASITPQRERQKLSEFKQVNREEKLVELLAKEQKKKPEEVWDEVANPLIEEYGSLLEAFEKIALGQDISAVIPKNWVEPLKEMVEKNIIVSQKILKGKIKAQALSSNGLEDIQEVFGDIQGSKKCTIIYVGGGTYDISCTGATFKDSDKTLTGVVEDAQKKAKKLGVSFEFKKEEAD